MHNDSEPLRADEVREMFGQLKQMFSQLAERVDSVEVHLAEIDGRLSDLEGEITDRESDRAALRALSHEPYRPARQQTVPTGGSIIEPIQEWRRRPGY